MPRPAINDDFTDFFTWMTKSEGKSITTARQYAITLRGVVRQCPEMVLRQADFVRQMEELKAVLPLKYVVVKSAWPWFARYKQSCGVEIPNFERKIETHEPIVVPKNVIDAARALHYHRVGIRLLVTLTWQHVDTRMLENPIALPIGISIAAPKLRGSIDAPFAAMKVLWDYARGENRRPAPEAPLIPYLPGGRTPVPLRVLQEQINEYETMSNQEYLAYIRMVHPPREDIITSANYRPPNLTEMFRNVRDEYEASKDAAVYIDPNDVDDEAEETLAAREAARTHSLSSVMGFDPDAD